MPYMLLMIEPTEQRLTRTESEGRAVYDRMVRFGESLKERGLLIASESLSSHASAARVQKRGGQPKIVDGPFSEAKEMVGGFFLVDCCRVVHGRSARTRAVLRGRVERAVGRRVFPRHAACRFRVGWFVV